MLAVACIGVVGVRQVSRARFEQHKRWMLVACALVLAFVASYAAKLAFLGREALETWEPRYVTVLRIHELCVLVMLVGGGLAVWQAKRLGLPDATNAGSAAAAGSSAGADAFARGVRLHRRAGFAALSGAIAGVLTAAYVLMGMFDRL